MKKVLIKNIHGVIAQSNMEDPTAWIAEGVAGNWWGLPERQVIHKDEPNGAVYDEADVLDEIIVIDVPAVEPVLIKEAIPAIPGSPAVPAVPAVLDENGNIVQPEIPAIPEIPEVPEVHAVYSEAIPAKTHKEVKLRAEYTVEIIDISAQVALENCMAARKAEYPTPEEFMNAFFDGGESAVAALQAKRLAIKQKYPKP